MNDCEQSLLPGRKPAGLWWGVGDSFQDIARARNQRGPYRRFTRRRFLYAVALRPEANVLKLSSPQDILDFTATYGRPLAWVTWPTAPRTGAIDWALVATRYDGIEITHLDRNGREYLDWLDIDWDAPSGCVWRARAVASLSLVTDRYPLDRQTAATGA